MEKRQVNRGKGELEGEKYAYHYDRAKRLALPNAPDLSTRGRKGIFKGNRSLLILLIDIVVICLLALFYKFFLYTPPFQARVAGYTVTLRGFAFQGGVVGNLQVEKTDVDARDGRIYVHFVSGDADLRLSSALPGKPGKSVELTGTLYPEGEPDELQAEIQVGAEACSLKRKLSRKD